MRCLILCVFGVLLICGCLCCVVCCWVIGCGSVMVLGMCCCVVNGLSVLIWVWVVGLVVCCCIFMVVVIIFV